MDTDVLDTLLKKLEKKGILSFGNKTCWRCGESYYHGFSNICNRCDKEIHTKDMSKWW